MLARDKPELGTELAPALELPRVTNGGYERGRDHGTNPWHFHQLAGLVVGACKLPDPLIVAFIAAQTNADPR